MLPRLQRHLSSLPKIVLRLDSELSLQPSYVRHDLAQLRVMVDPEGANVLPNCPLRCHSSTYASLDKKWTRGTVLDGRPFEH
jgi:hypothetical protein